MASYTVWKSSVTTSPINIDIDAGVSGQAADYIGLVNHNLFTNGATVTVKADTFSPPTTVRQAAFSPAENGVTLRLFTLTSALRYWRIVITDPAPPFAAAPTIGELWLGQRMTLPEYFTASFDPFLNTVDRKGSVNEAGHFVAAVSRGRMHRGMLDLGPAGASRAAFTSDLTPFARDHAELGYPFFIIVDPDDADFATPWFVRQADDAHVGRGAVGGTLARMTFSMEISEAYMELVA
jgi:hypothetical protein